MIGLPPSLDRVIGLSGGALDALLPMHIWADPTGKIVQAGPTLSKMVGKGDLTGKSMFSVIEVRRPAPVADICGLSGMAGQRIGLVLTAAPELPLRGALAPLPGGAGIILDISLGLSFARAVAGFGLTLNDFSPCDQTVELLYLHEANTSTMALSRHLSRRLQAAHAAAELQALTDPLTGLANRRAMDAAILRSLDDLGHDFGLLHIDLDLFKQVNDTLGHAAGDAVLARVGDILRHDMRKGDKAGRVGGDEFIVIVRDCTDRAELGRVAARLIAALEAPVTFAGQACRVSASIGIAASVDYLERPGLDQILADADAALYAAKRAGRGRFVLNSPAPAPQRRRARDKQPSLKRRQGDIVSQVQVQVPGAGD